MKIDGRVLANQILTHLKQEVRQLKQKHLIPHLAVVLVGSDPSSLSFIEQKKYAASKIGAKLTLHHFRRAPSYQKMAEFLRRLSRDKTVHGIIVQRPLPASLSASELTRIIDITKDVDGFRPKSPHVPPVGGAIFKLLSEIYFIHIARKKKPRMEITKPFLGYLKRQKIVLLGRGETAGRPIAETMSHFRLHFIILTSKSTNRDEYLTEADIIISATGKARTLSRTDIKPGAIVLGVGLHRQKGKMRGDFDEADIREVAGYYTPTPGGVGPVNVACLMENLIAACKIQKR